MMGRAETKLRGHGLLAAALALCLGGCRGTSTIVGPGDDGAPNAPGMGGAGATGKGGAAGPTGGSGGAAPATEMDGWPSFMPTMPSQLRRLTSEQYAATVATLLGVSTAG